MKSKILPLFVVVCFSPALLADTISWVGTTTGDWTTPTNWSNNAAPAAGNSYVVSGTGKAIVSPSGGGTLAFAGDSLTVSNGATLRLYSTSSGTTTSTDTIPNLTLDGATISPASNNGTVTEVLANQAAFANTVTVELNDTGTFTNTLTFNNGFAGSGSLLIKRSGGTGSGRNVIVNGTNSTAAYSGPVTVTGNASGKTASLTVNTATGWGGGSLSLGAWSSLTVGADLSGVGLVTMAANSSIQIGNGGATGTLPQDLVNNGSVTFNRTATLFRSNTISGPGSVSQSGTGATVLTGANTYTGGTTLNTGTLTLGNADAIGTTGNLTIKGGTLQFSASNKTDYSSRIHIADTIVSGSPVGANVTFDTSSRSVTFANPLTIDATSTVTLTKAGIGTLTLEGANTYTGATTISAGTFKLNGTLASPITVASGATLGGSGTTTGSLTLSSGSSLLVGNSHVTASGVSAAAVTLLPDAASVVAGTNLFTIVGYNGAGTPMVSEFSTAGFRNGFIADDAGNFAILFQFDAAARTWGGASGNWDLGTSASWTGGDSLFYNGDTATFGDIAADNLVTLTGALAPAAVTVANNTTFGYTFSGTGSIVGNTALSKSGPGNLTISTTNTFTGGTTLNGGTLTATAINALGTGAVTVTSGTIEVNGGSLPNTISGAGNILGTGTTQGTLSGNLSGLTGTATVSTTAGGKLAITGATVAPTTLPVTISSGATLYAASGATIAGTISVTGTGNTENLGALRLDTGAIASGAITLNTDSTIGSNSGTGTISGVIGEAGGVRALTKVGPGRVILASPNTYTGTTTINGGTLGLANGNNSIPGGTLAFSGSSTLEIGASTQSLASLTVTANGATGTITGPNGHLQLAGNDFQVGGSTGGQTRGVTMSGLGEFVFNDSAKRFVASAVTTSTGGTSSVILAATNRITASTVIVGSGENNQGSGVGTSNTRTSTLRLGQTNVINTPTITVASASGGPNNGTLNFNTGLVAAPTLKIRGTGGDTSSANINVGIAGNSDYSTGTGTVDLVTGATTSQLDALVGTLTVGQHTFKNGNFDRAVTGVFSMGGGVLTANTIVIGQKTATGGRTGSAANGTFSVTGGTVNAQTVTMGVRSDNAGTSVNSTFNLNGGARLLAATIQPGAGTAGANLVRTFNWNDGTVGNIDSNTDLTFSVPTVKLAATGTHTLQVDNGRTATVSAALVDATTGGALTKAGAGTAILSGANTYTGDTIVTGGTLTLPNAVLADTADVRLATGSVLNLTHAATDTVDELYIDGVQQAPGTWGSLTSSAAHKTALITGTGILQVTTGASAGGYDTWAAANAGGQPADGDFDNDGVKNGVEYFFGAPAGFTANPSAINGTITWPKDATAAATPIVETSADLVTWTPATFTDNGSTIQFTIPTGDSKRFVRLRVTVP